MEIFNYHTHTYRCGHACGSDEEYVQAAIKAGYKVLGFSDHAPYRAFPNKRLHMDFAEIDDYLDSIALLREKYEGQIRILAGFESEYFPDDHEERKYLHDRVDYFLLGQHYGNMDGSGSYFHQNSDEEILRYGRQVCAGIDSGLFTYLCHPDVFMSHQDEFNEACLISSRMILEKCVEKAMPLEVNVRGITKGKHGFRNGERYYYPHYEFWKIAAEYPVRVIIGIDAHAPEDLIRIEDIEAALEELKSLKLNYNKEEII